jgi:hypothetical protein
MQQWQRQRHPSTTNDNQNPPTALCAPPHIVIYTFISTTFVSLFISIIGTASREWDITAELIHQFLPFVACYCRGSPPSCFFIFASEAADGFTVSIAASVAVVDSARAAAIPCRGPIRIRMPNCSSRPRGTWIAIQHVDQPRSLSGKFANSPISISES